MKVVFTGGGTGGHFYPIIAVVQRVNQIIDQENIVGAKLYYFSDSPYDKEALFENGLTFEEVNAGKMRLYFSIKNFFDIFKMAIGVFRALIKLFMVYPDVVFGKGGYASFPTLLAARILRIPVIIHESDTAPGRVNIWAGKFAEKVALSFEEASQYFPKEKTACVGQPVRLEIEQRGEKNKSLDYFKITEEKLPVVLVLGGSLGAELINNTILDLLPKLLDSYYVIHQTGVRNFKTVKGESGIILENHPHKDRYLPYAFLNALQIKMASGAADMIISRAGSTLFEIASWGVPSILIPITKTNLDHQRKNAFALARANGCIVVEEVNMTPSILFEEIERIMKDPNEYARLEKGAKAFYKGDAAMKIARQIVNIALKHER